MSASPNSRAGKPLTPLKNHSLDSKSLLERWIQAKPWESRLMREINLDSPDMTPLSKKSGNVELSFNKYQQNGLVKARRNGVTTRISTKSLTNNSQSTPSSSAISSDCMYDDSPASTSCSSDSPSQPHKEERKISKPSYTKLTASTKAKVKASRHSSQNLRRLFLDDCLSHNTRTDFLSADTRSISGSYSSANIWKDFYATPLRASRQNRYTMGDK